MSRDVVVGCIALAVVLLLTISWREDRSGSDAVLHRLEARLTSGARLDASNISKLIAALPSADEVADVRKAMAQISKIVPGSRGALQARTCLQRVCQHYYQVTNWVYKPCGAGETAPAPVPCSNPQFDSMVQYCVDPSLPVPPSIAVMNMPGTGSGRFVGRADTDVVSTYVAKGDWEGDYRALLRNALETRRAEREAQLKKLGASDLDAHLMSFEDVELIDIGTNIGSISMPTAARGYRVVGFEAMPQNQQLLNIGICLNGLDKTMTIYRHGLSSTEQNCSIVDNPINLGNGMTICGPFDPATRPDVIVRATMRFRRLDDVMLKERETKSRAHAALKLDPAKDPLAWKETILKIDVELHEPEVLAGAADFFRHPQLRPKLILMEIWQQEPRAVRRLVEWGYAGFATLSHVWLATPADVDGFYSGPKWELPGNADHQDMVFVLPEVPGSNTTVAAAKNYVGLPASILDTMRTLQNAG